MSGGPDGPALIPTPDEAMARLREAAGRARDEAAAAVAALREERAGIERERREHPSYEQAQRERSARPRQPPVPP